MNRYISPFANTSLEEEPLEPLPVRHGNYIERSGRRRARLGTMMARAGEIIHSDSENGYYSDSSDEYRLDLPSGIKQLEQWDVIIRRQKVERREQEKAKRRAKAKEERRKKIEAIFAQGVEHAQSQKSLEEAFKAALKAWKKEDSKTHTKFVKHLALARQITDTDVRAHDIASWFKVEVPHAVRNTLHSLRESQHVQALLQIEYEHAAGLFAGVIDHRKSEIQYAADNYDKHAKLGYGYEENLTHPESPINYHLPDKIGHSLAEPGYIQQWLTAWMLRIEHASKQARYPVAPWEQSVDGVVHAWIHSVIDATEKAQRNGEYKQMAEGNWEDLRLVTLNLQEFHDTLVDRKRLIDESASAAETRQD